MKVEAWTEIKDITNTNTTTNPPGIAENDVNKFR